MAGKRKRKPQNVVKVDLSDAMFRKGEVLPVVVKHSSRDGRRVEQTVHQVPTPRQSLVPPTFDPSPAVRDDWDCEFPDTSNPTGELDGPDAVSSHSFPYNPSLRGHSLQVDPLRAWCADRDKVLRGLLLLEGRMGTVNGICRRCPNPGTFSCFTSTGLILMDFRVVPLRGLLGCAHAMRQLYGRPACVHPVPQDSGKTMPWFGICLH